MDYMHPPSRLTSLIDVWLSPQTRLPYVARWLSFDKKYDYRPQNVLQHSHSICLLGSIVLEMLGAACVDFRLLQTAFVIHDMGEGEIGHDTAFPVKSTQKDIEEYEAFKMRFSDNITWPFLQKAFLLQFCRKPLSEIILFPKEEVSLLVLLRTANSYEALIFEAVERLDYILYAVEQYIDQKDPKITFEVLKHHALIDMKYYSVVIPGWRSVWTPDMQTWAENFVAKYS